jgi:ABC-type branched-subunit amino acid transport system substrate-binding protein
MFIRKVDDDSSYKAQLLLFVIFALFITLIFVLFPVYSQELITQERSEKLNNKTVACILPLSGKYESIGKRVFKGILTARNVVQSENDYEIVVKDYGESDLELRKAFDEVVIKDGVSVVIGPFLSNSIKAVSESAKSLMIPTVVFPLYRDVLLDNSYVINFSYPLEKQAQVLARYAIQDMNMKSLGILYPKNDLGGLFKEAFVKAVMKFDREIIYIGSYDPKLLDVSTEVEWIKSRHPRAIFIPDGATHSGKLVVRLRQEGGLQDLIFLGPNTWNSRSFIKTVGPDADGIIFTDFFFSGSQRWIEFSDKFRAYFNEEPGFLEYQAYEAASLILHVLRTPIIKRDQIKERILSLRDSPLFDIAQNINGGLDITPKPLILTLKDMEVVRVK